MEIKLESTSREGSQLVAWVGLGVLRSAPAAECDKAKLNIPRCKNKKSPLPSRP